MDAVDTTEPVAEPTLDSLPDDGILLLDEQTLKDLEVFESETATSSLFEFCDHTRTNGGSRVLRRRMERPWSDAQNIRATQQSLVFILDNQEAFTGLLSLAYTARRVAQYVHEILPVVTQQRSLEFGVSAFAFWANYNLQYLNIVRGVQFTCKWVQALRRFIEREELASTAGELAPLLKEMTELLSRPGMSQVPSEEIGSFFWKILRLDQGFRLYDKQTIERLLQIIYEIDALASMAEVTTEHRFVLPEIEEGSLRVKAEELVHPFVQHAVANPVDLNQQHRLLFLTGPNMAGKTTYLRAFATALYFAHLGMGVPASRFCFVPAQRMYSSISLNDDLRRGVSYFRAEALRVKAVAKAVAQGLSVVAIMDEPFKGTNVKDAFDASLAVLERLAIRQNCLFMFSSHLIELSERFSNAGSIDCRYFDAEERGERLRFDYLLRPGISDQRLGMRVLREEGIFDLLDGTQTGSTTPT